MVFGLKPFRFGNYLSETRPMPMSDYDHPTPEDQAVTMMAAALRRKVEALVREGFEGWIGKIESGKYTLDVDLTLRKKE